VTVRPLAKTRPRGLSVSPGLTCQIHELERQIENQRKP